MFNVIVDCINYCSIQVRRKSLSYLICLEFHCILRTLRLSYFQLNFIVDTATIRTFLQQIKISLCSSSLSPFQNKDNNQTKEKNCELLGVSTLFRILTGILFSVGYRKCTHDKPHRT